MKKKLKQFYIIIICAFVLAIYYYVSLPAINIHAVGFWQFLLVAIFILFLIYMIRGIRKRKITNLQSNYTSIRDFIEREKFIFAKPFIYIFVGLFLVLILGSVLSSTFINAKKYQKLLTIEDRNFMEDITKADYSQIPLLDKDSASLLGNRKMGSMVEMVSQFEVASNYTQINYQDKPVRVTPLVYASFIKWLTNQAEGIPAYMKIDMTTQDTEVIKLDEIQVTEGIKYSESEYFNRNLYRHLRFKYPTYIFEDELFFEIDDKGIPYWVCAVKKFNIGLFGGQTIGKVVLCNAITGKCITYEVEDVPQWVDKVYSAELLLDLYDFAGTLQHGYWNSVLSQKDCLQSTNGYNYIALDDDVWVYTGITSVNGDQSNVGFVLMNQRTMETRFYRVEGAIEDSAMSSAEGQVQNLGYQATFPLLLNIENEPTYFLALKDDSGLVKKYAMVNVQKYQLVAIGDTVKVCQENYKELLFTNGIADETEGLQTELSGNIHSIYPITFNDTTLMYFTLEEKDTIFYVNLSKEELINIVKYETGDWIRFSTYDSENNSMVEVIQIIK